MDAPYAVAVNTGNRLLARAVNILPDAGYQPARRRRRPAPVPRQRGGDHDAPAATEPAPVASETRDGDSVPRHRADLREHFEDTPPPARPGVAMMGRAELLGRVESVLAGPVPHALIQFGLDGFRALNVRLGPAVGDAVLRRTGVALEMSYRDGELARVDGDCFAVLVRYDGIENLTAHATQAIAMIAAADLSDDGADVHATVSAGLTVLDRSELTAGAALLEADLAMTAAKCSGRNRLSIHR
jgi:diguanylate cyclase (GGDEF)-like protein